ncbi:MAG TPA: FlgD immunoglobulin-like domain containing protein [bacterium]|nr:FlgD immunoglobulin-like domain containing protein [bacterium]HNH32348.1 FlgD immunoglobulin-like domain containing protein [bacterium]HNO89432.1 FlgD immunoglobulin-like domain containing protein [bacterium]
MKDTLVTFVVIDSSDGGQLTSTIPVLTDINGQAIAVYQTGTNVGYNRVAAISYIPGSVIGMPDSTYFELITIPLDANAQPVASSLSPTIVSRNQNVSFKYSFVNTGTFPVNLIGDSTYIQITHTGSGSSYRTTLDTNVNKTIGITGATQLTFRADTVKLPSGVYGTGGDSMRIVLYGTLFDSAAATLDTLKFTFFTDQLDPLTVQNPAFLVIDSVLIDSALAVQGQDSILVRYYVRNTGEADAISFTVTDSISNAGATVTNDWVLLATNKPSTISGLSSQNFTQYYRVKGNAVLGTDRISSMVRAVDYNDAAQIKYDTLYTSDTLGIRVPAQLQITRTYIDTVYNTGILNRDQIVRIKSLVRNFGEESANLRVHFESDAGNADLDSMLTTTLNGGDSLWAVSRYFRTRNASGAESYRAFVDSGYGLISGRPLDIVDPISGNQVTFTLQDSAELKLNLFVDIPGDSLEVSDTANFNLRVTVTNIGEASLNTALVPVRVRLPINNMFRYQASPTLDSVYFVTVGSTFTIPMSSYQETPDYDSVVALLDTANAAFPLDVNTNSKSAIHTVRDSVFLKTSNTGNLIATRIRILSPNGAVDGTVSTFQGFTVETVVKDLSRLSGMQARMILPSEGLSTRDSLAQAFIQNVNDSVVTTWRIFSNTDNDSVYPLRVVYSGIDSTTGDTVISDTLKLSVTVVRRAEMTTTLRITGPVGALDDTLSFGQELSVEATIRNLGQAAFSGAGQITLNVPVGFDVVAAPNVYTFTRDTMINWTLRANASGSLQMTAVVNVLPNDENTDQPVVVFSNADTQNVVVVNPAEILNASITIQGVPGDSVSTDQIFVVSAQFTQSRSLTARYATIQFPNNSAYRLKDGEVVLKQISDLDNIVRWSVVAPSTLIIPTDNEQIDLARITFVGVDRNNKDSNVTAQVDKNFTLQRKAVLRLRAAIIEPVDAIDNFVTKNQTFRIQATVSNLGYALPRGQGMLLLDSLDAGNGLIFTEQDVANRDNIFDFDNGDFTASWLVRAPDGVVNHPLVLRFVHLPTDTNTRDTVTVESRSFRLAVSTEAKQLRVERIATDPGTTIYVNGVVDSIMALRLKNNSSTTNTNGMIVQEFKFVVETFDYKTRTYNDTNWTAYFDSITVRLMGEEVSFGRANNLGTDEDTAVVRVDQNAGLKKLARALAVDLDYGLAILPGVAEEVVFKARVKPAVAGKNPNFRLILVGVTAYDNDVLGSQDAGITDLPLLPAVDATGNLLGSPEANAGNTTQQMGIQDPENGGKVAQFGNFPNPFGSSGKEKTTFRFRGTGEKAVIEIYTLAGNLVTKLTQNTVDDTQVEMVWDGRNGNGEKVRNGVYIAVLKSGGEGKYTTKVMVVR